MKDFPDKNLNNLGQAMDVLTSSIKPLYDELTWNVSEPDQIQVELTQVYSMDIIPIRNIYHNTSMEAKCSLIRQNVFKPRTNPVSTFFIYFIISTYQYMMPLTFVRPTIQDDPSFHKND